jgi:hypothetical protein
MDDRETIRQRLIDAGAEAAYARTLAGPIAAAKAEVDVLAAEAASLRIRVETLWEGDMLELTHAHDRLLDDLFGGVAPAESFLESERMSGLIEVFAAFHALLMTLHTSVPDYLGLTRPCYADDHPHPTIARPTPIPSPDLDRRPRRWWRRGHK